MLKSLPTTHQGSLDFFPIKVSYADVVIWDPNAKETISAKTHHQNCDLNIYEGFEITGKAIMTIVGGEIKWKTDNTDLTEFRRSNL